jgi:hypothetical protein
MASDEDEATVEAELIDEDMFLGEWDASDDEKRRLFVLIQFGAVKSVNDLDDLYNWLKDGILPMQKPRAVK